MMFLEKWIGVLKWLATRLRVKVWNSWLLLIRIWNLIIELGGSAISRAGSEPNSSQIGVQLLELGRSLILRAMLTPNSSSQVGVQLLVLGRSLTPWARSEFITPRARSKIEFQNSLSWNWPIDLYLCLAGQPPLCASLALIKQPYVPCFLKIHVHSCFLITNAHDLLANE